MSIMSDYWLNQATSLQATTEVLLAEILRLKKYEDTVQFIANDYIELSYEKAQWQRDDWLKRCRKTISEAPLEWTENYGQGSEPWLKDDEK